MPRAKKTQNTKATPTIMARDLSLKKDVQVNEPYIGKVVTTNANGNVRTTYMVRGTNSETGKGLSQIIGKATVDEYVAGGLEVRETQGKAKVRRKKAGKTSVQEQPVTEPTASDDTTTEPPASPEESADEAEPVVPKKTRGRRKKVVEEAPVEEETPAEPVAPKKATRGRRKKATA